MNLLAAAAGVMSLVVAILCFVGFLICMYLLVVELPWLLAFAPAGFAYWWRRRKPRPTQVRTSLDDPYEEPMV